MDKVMGGIAEALVATGVGLFVAIPAVVAYNIFQKKIGDIEDNVASIGKRLCAFLGAARADEVHTNGRRGLAQRAADSVRDLAKIESGQAPSPVAGQ
jgi:biopolymer transport protein ExbB/biopolymer transport protein TolQ